MISLLENWLAESMKSMDLKAPTYQKLSALKSTLTKYVDNLADFEGATFSKAKITDSEIKERVTIYNFTQRCLFLAFCTRDDKNRISEIQYTGSDALVFFTKDSTVKLGMDIKQFVESSANNGSTISNELTPDEKDTLRVSYFLRDKIIFERDIVFSNTTFTFEQNKLISIETELIFDPNEDISRDSIFCSEFIKSKRINFLDSCKEDHKEYTFFQGGNQFLFYKQTRGNRHYDPKYHYWVAIFQKGMQYDSPNF